LAHDPSGAVLQSIIDQGELRRMVGNLPVWAAAGMQFLDGPPTMPNAAEAASWSWRSAGRVHWIVLSHTLALLTRIAQSPRGAQALVHFGLPDKLAACSALSAHPICRRGEAAEVIITVSGTFYVASDATRALLVLARFLSLSLLSLFLTARLPFSLVLSLSHSSTGNRALP
jgi:hypothetical protein